LTASDTETARTAANSGGFRRVLLKLSGEALMGSRDYGIDVPVVKSLAAEISAVRSSGVDVAVVVGAGNFYRGLAAAAEGMERATADYAGMLATLLNALALQDALERDGADTRVQSAIAVSEVAEPYIRRKAIRHLEKGRIVIFAAGTGNPFFTTDTRRRSARSRSARRDPDGEERRARRLRRRPAARSDRDLLAAAHASRSNRARLKVMDTTALSLCMDNKVTIHVFELADGNIARVVAGEEVGTIIETSRRAPDGNRRRHDRQCANAHGQVGRARA
jgi:Uridylate kinase